MRKLLYAMVNVMLLAAVMLPRMLFAAGSSAPARTMANPRPVTAADLQGLEEFRKTAVAALGITNAPRFDLDLIANGINSMRLRPYTENGWAKGVRLPSFEDIRLSPEDMSEIVGLCIRAADIFVRVSAREEAHRRQLAARGVADFRPPRRLAASASTPAGTRFCSTSGASCRSIAASSTSPTWR